MAQPLIPPPPVPQAEGPRLTSSHPHYSSLLPLHCPAPQTSVLSCGLKEGCVGVLRSSPGLGHALPLVLRGRQSSSKCSPLPSQCPGQGISASEVCLGAAGHSKAGGSGLRSDSLGPSRLHLTHHSCGAGPLAGARGPCLAYLSLWPGPRGKYLSARTVQVGSGRTPPTRAKGMEGNPTHLGLEGQALVKRGGKG